MSEDKYLSIFTPKRRLVCLLSFKSFRNASSFENWGIFLSFSRGIFGQFLSLNWGISEISIIILKQWIAFKARADWLVKLPISFAIYLRTTREK